MQELRSTRPEGPRPKKPPRWRDLSDEEQWSQIYADRERAKAAAPKSPTQAAALALPAYCLQMAVDDCHKTFQATIRHDVHVSIVSTMAKVAAGLTTERKREKMLRRMDAEYQNLKGTGFWLNNVEFLYANACALVRLVDEYRFPPDAPVTMAAIMLKEDAELDEEGDWRLDKVHAIKMTGICYDGYIKTNLYAYPDGNLR